MAEVNITRQKQAFLTSQVRLLSTPLTLPPTTSSSSTNSNDIPTTTLEPLLAKVNKQITSHNRLVFGIQSQRHVAEQIDALYWQDVLREGLPVVNDTDHTATVVRKDVDLSNFRDVERNLGEEWDDICLRPKKRRRRDDADSAEAGKIQRRKQREKRGGVEESHVESENQEGPEEDEEDAEDEDGADLLDTQQQYATLRQTLLEQTQRRDELRNKISRYKKLQDLLRPLENAKENVQPNLVTRDNEEIEAELARMRVLLARAGNAIQAMPDTVRKKESDGTVVTPDERMEGLLALG